MSKRRNLFLLAFLFGSLTKLLPFILWLICVVPIAVCLFLAFDFWEYERHVGGTSNDLYRKS